MQQLRFVEEACFLLQAAVSTDGLSQPAQALLEHQLLMECSRCFEADFFSLSFVFRVAHRRAESLEHAAQVVEVCLSLLGLLFFARPAQDHHLLDAVDREGQVDP